MEVYQLRTNGVIPRRAGYQCRPKTVAGRHGGRRCPEEIGGADWAERAFGRSCREVLGAVSLEESLYILHKDGPVGCKIGFIECGS